MKANNYKIRSFFESNTNRDFWPAIKQNPIGKNYVLINVETLPQNVQFPEKFTPIYGIGNNNKQLVSIHGSENEIKRVLAEIRTYQTKFTGNF